MLVRMFGCYFPLLISKLIFVRSLLLFVADEIPPKKETVIDVELTTLQKQYYRAIFEKNHAFLFKGTKGALPKLMNIQVPDAFNTFTRNMSSFHTTLTFFIFY